MGERQAIPKKSSNRFIKHTNVITVTYRLTVKRDKTIIYLRASPAIELKSTVFLFYAQNVEY